MSNELTIRDELLLSIQKFETMAKNIVVTTADARDAADDNLKLMNSLKKAIVADLAEEKSIRYKSYQDIQKIEKKYTNVVDSCVKSFKQAILTYDIEEEKKREKERLRLQAIADEQARKERERLEKQAAKVKSEEKKEALLAQAEMIESSVVQIQEDEKPKGSSYIKSTWKHRVTDFNALPNEYKIPNDELLSKMAQSTKGHIPVPGVEWYEEKTLVSGRKG